MMLVRVWLLLVAPCLVSYSLQAEPCDELFSGAENVDTSELIISNALQDDDALKQFPQQGGFAADNPECHKFYQTYLAKYYPRVFVITEHYFNKMSPAQVAEAIADVVHIFAEKPWFYFFDDEKGFKLSAYWEYVVDQCSYINAFLKKARVNLETKEIILEEESTKTLAGSNRGAKGNLAKTKNLFMYLRDTGYTSIYDFYALSFDYLVKLFNEGILLRNRTLAEHYYYELDFVVKKMFKSKYEPDYLEALKTCAELMAILKTEHKQDDESYYEDAWGQDADRAASGDEVLS